MSHRLRFALGASLMTFGVAGLALNFYGLLRKRRDKAASGGARRSTRDDVDDFFFRRPTEVTFDWVCDANGVVDRALLHGHRTIRPYENWMLWLGGLLWYPLRDTQDPEVVLASGRGICDDAANVLQHQLARLGVASRFVVLPGHVVLEVETSRGWVVADPDYGVAYPYPAGELAEHPDDIRSRLEAVGWSPAKVTRYLQIIEKDSVRLHAIGQALGRNLARVEAVANVAKWPAALGFLIEGSFLARRSP